VVAFVALRSSGDGTKRADVPRQRVVHGEVTATDFEYSADIIIVAAGDVLTFENRGPSRHTLTADDGRFDSGVVEPGHTFTVALDGPRELGVHCEIHPAMRAHVTVTAP
jgi:plastocyanin